MIIPFVIACSFDVHSDRLTVDSSHSIEKERSKPTESRPTSKRARMKNDLLYRTQPPRPWPKGLKLTGTEYTPNIYTGLLVEVPFIGTATLVQTYDIDRSIGRMKPTFEGLPVADNYEWLSWRLPAGSEVIAPRKGIISMADTTVGCPSKERGKGLRIFSGWFGFDVELLGVEPRVSVGEWVDEGQVIGVVAPRDASCESTLTLGVFSSAPERWNPLMREDVGPFFRLSPSEWERLLGRADAADQIQKHALVCNVGLAAPEDCPLTYHTREREQEEPDPAEENSDATEPPDRKKWTMRGLVRKLYERQRKQQDAP